MKTYYNEHSNQPGVYKIINTSNGRIYIGSAKEFKDRYRDHIKSLQKGTHHNKFLQNDWNKCGPDVFEYHVVEVVQGTQAERLLREQTYIDQYHDNQKNCYNFDKKTNKKKPTKKKKKKIQKNIF